MYSNNTSSCAQAQVCETLLVTGSYAKIWQRGKLFFEGGIAGRAQAPQAVRLLSAYFYAGDQSANICSLRDQPHIRARMITDFILSQLPGLSKQEHYNLVCEAWKASFWKFFTSATFKRIGHHATLHWQAYEKIMTYGAEHGFGSLRQIARKVDSSLTTVQRVLAEATLWQDPRIHTPDTISRSCLADLIGDPVTAKHPAPGSLAPIYLTNIVNNFLTSLKTPFIKNILDLIKEKKNCSIRGADQVAKGKPVLTRGVTELKNDITVAAVLNQAPIFEAEHHNAGLTRFRYLGQHTSLSAAVKQLVPSGDQKLMLAACRDLLAQKDRWHQDLPKLGQAHRCHTCDTEIRPTKTADGKKIWVDADTWFFEKRFDEAKHTQHSCAGKHSQTKLDKQTMTSLSKALAVFGISTKVVPVRTAWHHLATRWREANQEAIRASYE